MKNDWITLKYDYTMKRNGILLLLGGMLAWQPLVAQQTATFAALEAPYTRSQYFNTPYYAGEEYVAGTLDLATGIQYTDIPTRIDLFRQQVVVLTPEEKRPVIVPHQKLTAVRLHGQEFRYHEPEGKPGEPEAGYLRCIYTSEKCLLVESLTYTQKEQQDERALRYRLLPQQRYYLLAAGKWTRLRSLSDLTKLYPEKKKQIRQTVGRKLPKEAAARDAAWQKAMKTIEN